jgi:hypothetical protein
VDKHFPGTSINRCSDEVPVLVGGLTNMIFECSKADAIPGAMALRTFTDRLTSALAAIRDEPTRKAIGVRVIQGFTQVADPALATREFAPRVQIVGALKNREYLVTWFDSASERTPTYSKISLQSPWRFMAREALKLEMQTYCGLQGSYDIQSGGLVALLNFPGGGAGRSLAGRFGDAFNVEHVDRFHFW